MMDMMMINLAVVASIALTIAIGEMTNAAGPWRFLLGCGVTWLFLMINEIRENTRKNKDKP